MISKLETGKYRLDQRDLVISSVEDPEPVGSPSRACQRQLYGRNICWRSRPRE